MTPKTGFARRVVGMCGVLGLAAIATQTAAADCYDQAGRGANWQLCNKTGINLVGEDIAFVHIFGADFSGASLTGANLESANASSADLTNTTLTNANLSEAALFRTWFNGANLVGANLTDAVLIQADLTGANLTGASLTRANLLGANLKDAKLAGANLDNATWIDGTTCAEGSVGSCKDPSSVDLATNERVTGAVDQVFAVANFLSDRGPNKRAKETAFRALLNDSFDMEVIRRFAIGKYWGRITDEEREEYSHLLTESFVDMFTDYYAKGSKNYLEIVSIKLVPSKPNTIRVETFLLDSSGDYTVWYWTVRYNDGQNRIVDASRQGEFGELLNIRAKFLTLLDEGDGTIKPLLSYLRSK